MADLPPLRTCSWMTYRPDMGPAIRTSLGRPRQFAPTEYESMHSLMPYGAFHLEGDECRRVYRARLHRLRPRIERELVDLGRKYPGWNLILLCYERDRRRCHRDWLAEWIAERYDIDVPEAT